MMPFFIFRYLTNCCFFEKVARLYTLETSARMRRQSYIISKVLMHENVAPERIREHFTYFLRIEPLHPTALDDQVFAQPLQRIRPQPRQCWPWSQYSWYPHIWWWPSTTTTFTINSRSSHRHHHHHWPPRLGFHSLSFWKFSLSCGCWGGIE